jgi:hypothetical protein
MKHNRRLLALASKKTLAARTTVRRAADLAREAGFSESETLMLLASMQQKGLAVGNEFEGYELTNAGWAALIDGAQNEHTSSSSNTDQSCTTATPWLT